MTHCVSRFVLNGDARSFSYGVRVRVALGQRYVTAPSGQTPFAPEQPRASWMGDVFEGRAAIGYDHGYDAEVFYLGLVLDPKYVEGFVEGCLERIGGDDPEGEMLIRDLWEDEAEKETVLSILKAECDVLPGRPAGSLG